MDYLGAGLAALVALSWVLTCLHHALLLLPAKLLCHAETYNHALQPRSA